MTSNRFNEERLRHIRRLRVLYEFIRIEDEVKYFHEILRLENWFYQNNKRLDVDSALEFHDMTLAGKKFYRCFEQPGKPTYLIEYLD